jgi:hypothetical protein
MSLVITRFHSWRLLPVFFETFKVTKDSICGHLARFFQSITFSHQSGQRGTGDDVAARLIRRHNYSVVQYSHGTDYNTQLLSLTTCFFPSGFWILALGFCTLLACLNQNICL